MVVLNYHEGERQNSPFYSVSLPRYDFALESQFSQEINFMAISPELLEILRCPKCKSEVKIDDAATRLKCVNPECSLVYPIRDEIPVMLIDEATVEK